MLLRSSPLRQHSGWHLLEFSLADVRRRIHETGHYDESLQKEFKAILDREQKSLLSDTSCPHINEKLRRQCFNEVIRELPVEEFFVPKD